MQLSCYLTYSCNRSYAEMFVVVPINPKIYGQYFMYVLHVQVFSYKYNVVS